MEKTRKVPFDRRVLDEPCRKWPECYKMSYPDDPEAYCTCMDYTPEI